MLYFFIDEHTPPKVAGDTIALDGAMRCGLSDKSKRELGAKDWDNSYPQTEEGYYVEPIRYEDGETIKTIWSDPIKIEEEDTI